MEDDLRALQWEHEVLEQRFEKIQSERDELYTKFVKVMIGGNGDSRGVSI